LAKFNRAAGEKKHLNTRVFFIWLNKLPRYH